MSTATPTERLSVDAYLAGESNAVVKSEYLGGIVYAMGGGTNRHNQIATNVLGLLHSRLRGHPCRAFNSDTKIRIRLPHEIRFYYPDASVVCQLNPISDTYQDQPVVVVEVLSPSTRRIDEGEKKDAYLSVPSLMSYVLVEPDYPGALVFQRTDEGFVRHVFSELQATIPFEDLGVELLLSEIYE
ncbi:MAG: Uma2 family endonuclease [Pirellulaceae bacterium]